MAQVSAHSVNRREGYATAAPTTGNFVVADRVWNSAPAVGAPLGWICTVAGSPGTWVPFWGLFTQPAANADTSGAVLADLETEVNQLKAALRTAGIIDT
jgi:hypothetical protein